MVLATEADLCAEAVSRCSTQVQQWLAGHSPLLEDYHQPLIEQGYGDLSLLRQLTQAEAAALADDLAMKSGHKKVFLQALLQQLPVDKLRGRLQVPEPPMQVLALVARDLNGWDSGFAWQAQAQNILRMQSGCLLFAVLCEV